jgi:hypothetical protein
MDPQKQRSLKFQHARRWKDGIDPVPKIDLDHPMADMGTPHVLRRGIHLTPPPHSLLRSLA